MKIQKCKISGAEFEISDWEVEFLRKISPEGFPLPLPELCPDERMRLRTMQRNEDKLHRTQGLISIYSDDTYKLLSHEQWWDGSWDAGDFGRDLDFGRGFFEQFRELDLAVPRVALIQVGNENCPYSTGTAYCRNCHLIDCSENCEDCMYGKLLQDCRDVMDSDYAYECELCYECFSVEKCYNCKYLSYSQNCSDCLFSENLRGCRNCFLCTNLNNKEYYFMNKPVSKEFYQQVVADCQVEKAMEILERMRAERIHKYANIVNCEGCSGDFLSGCKNCLDCFDVNDSEDCRYVQVGVQVRDLLDCSNMYLKPELSYQVLGTIGTYNVHFSLFIFHSQDVWYSQFCYDSSNLFGCVGLRNKQYCIFNKQYSQAEYEELVPRIMARMVETGEWGQFFPAWMSPFPYNDTVAGRYLPLAREEAVGRGYRWIEPDGSEKVLQILERERQFLEKMKLPLPTLTPQERAQRRIAMRGGMRLYDRVCAKSGEKLLSPYPPESGVVVYGEKSYLEEVGLCGRVGPWE